VTGDVISALTTAAALGGGVRWLRVAQREHYIPGSVTRFALRWWGSRPENKVLAALLVASVGVAWAGWWEGAAAAAVISLGAPLGLSYRGRSAKLAWTRRLRTLAAVASIVVIAIAALGAVLGVPVGVSATLAAGVPLVTDLALAATVPLERRLSATFVRSAARRLEEVSPRVVAITGSYGKTSTKFYAGHLLRARYATATSPASFNNAAGLSRTVNERLAPGTEVLVAEMGTYGPGEIRALCDWLTPEIGVITAIGPVHLERMGSLDNIARAKSEILERARVAVLNIDSAHLAALGDGFRQRGGELIQCSSRDQAADVYVSGDGDKLAITVRGQSAGIVDLPGAFGGNLACAVGVALAMDLSISEIASRLATLTSPEHRQTIARTPDGITVIDDTYNANPEGSLGALATLQGLGAGQRKVVVTPGMVELGREQFAANETFARQAAKVATDILVVGRTNRRALLRGAATGPASVVVCADRAEAVGWVRRHLTSGGVVLYENDLPDHYP
jgi:UDP-N-acetylmuramoyl-tripeptide--D-alanyl-D-alanine ligase